MPLHGMTLHRWSGVGKGTDPFKVMLGRAWGRKKSKRHKEKWGTTKVLIIDEVSMISAR